MKAVFNARNVGPERSTINAIQHVKGNAAIIMASDLQDPPELIPLLVREWEAGAKVVVTQYLGNQESWLRKYLRKAYYWLMSQIRITSYNVCYTKLLRSDPGDSAFSTRESRLSAGARQASLSV